MDMAEKSAYNEIKRKVKSSKRGTLFFPDLFAHTASSDAVRSALVRLCKGRDIIRVAQGIYCYPIIDEKCESGFITPSVEEIAEGIAKAYIKEKNLEAEFGKFKNQDYECSHDFEM